MATTDQVHLMAQTRDAFGKGAARRVRRAGRVPAVVYGHGMQPLHVALPGHQTMMSLKHRNAVLEVEVDGTTHLTLARAIQRDAVRGTIEHVDLVVVRRDERVEVDIPVTAHGAGAPDAIVTVEHATITVSAPAIDLPEGVDVDVTGFEVGRTVLAGELVLPAGVQLVTDPDAVVVHATQSRAAAESDELDTPETADAADAAGDEVETA